jgi:hypothetical protein
MDIESIHIVRGSRARTLCGLESAVAIFPSEVNEHSAELICGVCSKLSSEHESTPDARIQVPDPS